MNDSTKEISVVICHHTGELIYKCVESVKKSIDITYEIIIMTSDTNLALKGIPGCRLYYSEEPPTHKRNYATKYMAESEYVVYLDDDVEIDSMCLRTLLNKLVGMPQVGMIYGKLYKMDEVTRFDEAGGYLTFTGFIYSRAEQNLVDRKQYDYDIYIFAGKSALCILRKSVFIEVGGFDEDFGILGEESDLSWRMWLMGHKVAFCYQAFGYHAFNTKFKPVKQFYTNHRIYFNGCKNYISMWIKNAGVIKLCLVLPIHLAIWASVGSVMCLSFSKFRSGLLVLKGLMYSILTMPNTLKKRAIIQKKRKVSDRELFSYIGYSVGWKYYAERVFRYLTGCTHG